MKNSQKILWFMIVVMVVCGVIYYAMGDIHGPYAVQDAVQKVVQKGSGMMEVDLDVIQNLVPEGLFESISL